MSASATRRPVLLLLLYGAVLLTVGITASSQAAAVSNHFSAAALNATVESDAAAVRGLVSRDLEVADLSLTGSSSPRTAELEAALATLTADGAISHAEIRLPDGTVVASNVTGLAGLVVPADAQLAAATQGQGAAGFLAVADAAPASGVDLASLVTGPTVLREVMPLRVADGSVAAVVMVWRDAAPILSELDTVRREVVTLTLSAAIVVAVLITFIFRSAQRRLTRQTAELVEATRRDALTGLLNHGALVAALIERIETARVTGAILGVSIVDVDGFRALNDTHGHEIGDDALLEVAEALEKVRRPGSVIGRYGPDEFLVVVGAADAGVLRDDVERLRADLAELAMVVPGAEPLPLTVSAGIATYPTDGDSATSLLSAAAAAVGLAAASGGNAVRLAEVDQQGAVGAATFDVFQGLVLAINTKDRYTKRHSEDVARYAIFLARQLGLDEGFMEMLRVAGLLHDVGKIGIPDPILRKPGRLTAAEFDILKQHVALGDAIVRDLPEIDSIRAGIRHHHERIDGRGYLAGLRGEDIPLVARILAIGDAFSAMTTSRPYRKGLSAREAMRRLGDAAGTQLDERLVGAFLAGMESAPDAPVPGIEAAPVLWTPAARVA